MDDTHIDYPVVQGEDDMEYINKDVYGQFALSGSIFLSSVNSRDFTDPYSLVYGHHMANGAMFGDIIEFADPAYFEAHTTGTLYLPEQTIPITLFACVETSASDPVVYNPQAQEKEASCPPPRKNERGVAPAESEGVDEDMIDRMRVERLPRESRQKRLGIGFARAFAPVDGQGSTPGEDTRGERRAVGYPRPDARVISGARAERD